MTSNRSFSIALVACVAILNLAAAHIPTVMISQGAVTGTTTALPAATDRLVDQWLGVPFAESPPKRFAPPRPPKRAAGNVLIAQKWKPKCIETFSLPPLTDSADESEDCLYLNIYAPANSTSRGKPVLFWLYGGHLQFGNAGQPAYDGTSFAANQDIVVVTTNYRTNVVFGFSNSPGLALAERNAGFHDQRLALKWVQDHIGAFGGDSNAVTIFGESSGASSVDRLVTSPPSGPLPFHAAILQSGQASVSPWSQWSGPSHWHHVVKACGCKRKGKGKSKDDSELACMQNVDANCIKRAVMKKKHRFFPQNDGVTQKATPLLKARAEGRTAQVPLLIGTNRDEGTLLVAALVKKLRFLGENSDKPAKGIGEKIKGFFRSIVNDVVWVGTKLFFHPTAHVIGKLIFTCPARLVSISSRTANLPTWRYLYDASFPNLGKVPKGRGIKHLGAYHSAEIPLIFGTYSAFMKHGPPTQTEIELSTSLQKAWADFARYPWFGPGWTDMRKDEHAVGCLGCQANMTGVSVMSRHDMDHGCWRYNILYNAHLALFKK